MSGSLHKRYMDEPKHHCTQSEQFAGCDALLSIIALGWAIRKEVLCERHFFTGNRSTNIYHFYLMCDGKHKRMSVLENPAVVRVIQQYQLQVLTIHKRQSTQSSKTSKYARIV